MKKDLFKKYKKYELWFFLTLIMGTIGVGCLGIIIMVFINMWVGLLTVAILAIVLFKVITYLDNKSIKYMLESYEYPDDPYEYVL